MTIELVHEARYTARPTKKHGPTETKAGAPRYEITFEIYEDGKPSGTEVRYSGALDGDWSDRTFETLKTCGAVGTDIYALVLDYATDVRIRVKEGSYNGRKTFEAQYVDPARRALATDKAASIAERLKAKLGAAAPAKPATGFAAAAAGFGAPSAPASGGSSPWGKTG